MQPDQDPIRVPWDIITWQNEALMLPIEQVRDKAVENLNMLNGMLNNLNVLVATDHQADCQADDCCEEAVETTLVAAIMTAVSAAIFILGAAQRNPDGVRIISPVAPQMN